MFNEVTDEMYEAREAVITDIADYAATEAVYSLSWMDGAPKDEDDLRAIYWNGGRGDVTVEHIDSAIVDNIGNPHALFGVDTHILVLALQSYRYNGAGELHTADGYGVNLDTLLAHVIIDQVLEDSNGEMSEVVNKALA